MPDFIAGGSEQPDGSTLTQDPGSVLLFSPPFSQDDLDNLDDGKITNNLRQQFANQNVMLSTNAIVSVRTDGGRWLIIDEDDSFLVKTESNGLNVYSRLEYTLTRPDGSQQVFDRFGRLLRLVDARDRAVSYSYDGDVVKTITDEAGQRIELRYDGQGRVAEAARVENHIDIEVVAYEYYSTGDLETATRMRQGTSITYSYKYDDEHHITKVTLPNQVEDGNWTTDILGRVSQRGDARGNQFDSSFDPNSGTTVTTDSISGTTVVQQTDSLGRPIAVTDELGRTTRYFYGGTNRQPSIVLSPDPTRPWLYFEYDANGNVTRAEDIARGGDAFVIDTNGDGEADTGDGIDDHPLLFTYDASNNLIESTDARGLVTRYTYEVLNEGTADERITDRRTSLTRAVGTSVEATWTWQYDPVTGYLTRQIDPSGVVTEYGYDPLGNRDRETVAPGTDDETTTLFDHDDFSRIIEERVVLGRNDLDHPDDLEQDRVTTFTYDGRDQVLSTTFEGPPPIGSLSTYDPVTGRKLTDTDFNENVTTYSYDPVTGDLIEVNEEGAVTRLKYDRFGNLERLIDPVGNVTLFEYDDLQRLVRTISLGATPRVLGAIGTRGGLLFDVDPDLAAQLDNSSIPDGLCSAFETNGVPLSDGATVDVEIGGSQWLIMDPDVQFLIRLEDRHLNVYDSDGTQLFGINRRLTADLDNGEIPDDLRAEFERSAGALTGSANVTVKLPGNQWLIVDAQQAFSVRHDNGQLNIYGSGLVVRFSEPIETSLVDNGIDIVVEDSSAQAVTGTTAFSADGKTLFWFAEAASLDPDTYQVTLAARNPGEFTTTDGRLVDGEFFGMLPSGDNVAGGDFVFDWLVDDHGNNSRHVTSVAIPSSTAGDLEFRGDADWFRFDAVAGNRYRFEVVLGAEIDSLLDSVLLLYDLDGQTLLEINDDIDAANGQFASRIEWEAPRTGTYYLSVRGFANAWTGKYQLDVNPLADDHSDDPESATLISVPSVTPGQLELPTDADVFSFDAVEGQQYRITTILDGIEDGLEDSVLRLFEYDETTVETKVLAENDNSFANNPAAFLFWEAATTGTYYIQVSSHYGQHDGSYELALSVDDHGDHPGAATPVAVDSQTVGDVEVRRDRDWFSFDATQNSDYRVDVTLDALEDSRLLLLGPNGTEFQGANDNYDGLGSTIFWTAPTSGTYYLRADGRT